MSIKRILKAGAPLPQEAELRLLCGMPNYETTIDNPALVKYVTDRGKRSD